MQDPKPSNLSNVRPANILAIAECFSVDEVEALTGIKRSTIYEEIKTGQLAMRKCRGRSVILRDDLRAWVVALPLSNLAATWKD